MKAVILAGGFGTRLSEETVVKPKPMVRIGGYPILWHIMKIYHHYGIKDFVVCLGYKGYYIKDYFLNYFSNNSDITVNLFNNTVEFHRTPAEDWRITMVDTGLNIQTGGRLKRVAPYLGDEPFCMTYGDAVTDLDIGRIVDFHRQHGRLATVTAVRPVARFGTMRIEGHAVTSFVEKPLGDGGWINGGFFVLSPGVLDMIDDDATLWEHEPLNRLTGAGELRAFQHNGFWHCIDTLRDQRELENLWATANPPWRVWGEGP